MRHAVLVVALLVALDLGFFAARFHPYLTPEVADLPVTPSIRYLRSVSAPFRVAPMFDDLWPNSAELLRVEDVRSHFSSEARYRQMMKRIDPESWGSSGTVLQFNSLRVNFDDPFLALLNVRYYLEQPSIDILRWKVEERSRRVVEATSRVVLENAELTSALPIDADDTKAVAILLDVESANRGALVRARAERPESGTIVGAVSVPIAAIRTTGRLYLPFRERVRRDEQLLLTLESSGARVVVPMNGRQVSFAAVSAPMVPAASFSDGRIFENLTVMPRYFAVWNVQQMPFDQLLEKKEIDLRSTAVVESDAGPFAHLSQVNPATRRVRFKVERYDGSRQRIVTDSAVPYFFGASEKFSPDLEVSVDGKKIAPTLIDGLFIGFEMPAGHHTVELTRILGRGQWPFSLAGLLLFGVFSWIDRPRARP
jgi:hypothetical protein